MALRAAGFVVIQTATPSEDPVTVGYLWADTANNKLKQCTGVSPYVWAEIGPFTGTASLATTLVDDPTLYGTVQITGKTGATHNGILKITENYEGDAAVRAAMIIRRDTQHNSGTPTIGDGAEYLIQLKDTNGNYGNLAGVGGRARTVAPTTLIGRLELNAKASGAYNVIFDDVVMVVDGAGVVGIGSHWATISNVPSEMLHLYDGNALIEASGSSGVAGWQMKTPTHRWQNGVQAGDHYTIYDATAAADRLVIDKTSGAITTGNWQATAISKQFGGTGVDNTTQTYTPTVTGVTNIDSVTAVACQYTRLGNIVIVSGSVQADPTTSGLDTEFGLSLPIASNFAASGNCGGTACARDVAGEVVAISADATNDRADFRWVAGSNANRTYRFMFMYQVL